MVGPEVDNYRLAELLLPEFAGRRHKNTYQAGRSTASLLRAKWVGAMIPSRRYSPRTPSMRLMHSREWGHTLVMVMIGDACEVLQVISEANCWG